MTTKTNRLSEEEINRILNSEELYVQYIRENIGGLEAAMIDKFYEATNLHKYSRDNFDWLDGLRYIGPLFGKKQAFLWVSPQNEDYNLELKKPNFYFKALDYDTNTKLYLSSDRSIEIESRQ
ncbi:MAG: hypothetical protein AABW51_01760 [Nanoarchaeota archaeon]